jgi:hypothetical protein
MVVVIHVSVQCSRKLLWNKGGIRLGGRVLGLCGLGLGGCCCCWCVRIAR